MRAPEQMAGTFNEWCYLGKETLKRGDYVNEDFF